MTTPLVSCLLALIAACPLHCTGGNSDRWHSPIDWTKPFRDAALFFAPRPLRALADLLFGETTTPVETATPLRVLPYGTLLINGSADSLSTDAAGRIVAIRCPNRGVRLYDLEQNSQLLYRPFPGKQVRMAPGGTWALVQAHDALLGVTVRGGTKFRIATRCVLGDGPAVSPDERWLAWCDDESRELVVRDLTNETEIRRPLPPQRRPTSRPDQKPLVWADLRFSPDGQSLLLMQSDCPPGSSTYRSTFQIYSVASLVLVSESTARVRSRFVEFPGGGELLLAGRFGLRKATVTPTSLSLPDFQPRERPGPDHWSVGMVHDLAISPDGRRFAIIRAKFRVIDAVGRSVPDGFSLHVLDGATLQEIWGLDSIPKKDGVDRNHLAFVDDGRALLVVWDGVRQYRLLESRADVN